MTGVGRPRELRPQDRARLHAWLARRGVDWPPGRTVVLDGGRAGWAAAAHLGDAPVSDGYHREHVRSVHVAGSPDRLAQVAAAAVALASADLRLEAELPATDESGRTALEDAGLELEARSPGGWSAGAADVDLVYLGRPGHGRRRPAPAPPQPPRRGEERGACAVEVRRHDVETRAALAAFLEGLIPGRSYPPGVLLSESERAETRRPGDLDAAWLLAVEPSGCVVGALVVAPERRRGREHVGRVHVDVAERARGRGLAAALFARSLRLASSLGLRVLEADPRAGNRAVRAALVRGGFVESGTWRRAWRMRTPAARWDEDVVLAHAAALPGPVELTVELSRSRPGRGASSPS